MGFQVDIDILGCFLGISFLEVPLKTSATDRFKSTAK